MERGREEGEGRRKGEEEERRRAGEEQSRSPRRRGGEEERSRGAEEERRRGEEEKRRRGEEEKRRGSVVFLSFLGFSRFLSPPPHDLQNGVCARSVRRHTRGVCARCAQSMRAHGFSKN